MNEKEKLINIAHKATHHKIILANKSLDPIKTANFFFNLERCIKSNEYQLNIKKGPIVIVLDDNSVGTSRNILLPANLGSYLESGASKKCNVLITDYDGNIVNEDCNDLIVNNPADAADMFSAKDIIVFFIYGNRLDIFYRGNIIDCIPDIFSYSRAVKIGDTTLPAKEYRKLISSHCKSRILKKNYLSYWKNKKERLLVASPEDIFGKDLAWYLDQHVADGHVDVECYNAWTDNRTDIRIIRYEDGSIYILEVKWLGQSISYGGSKTTYTDDRANEGIVQLNEYLGDDPNAICGVLIIYDARKDDVDIVWEPKIKRDARVDDPMRFYLISESASKKATRIVKGSKNK